MTLVHAEVEKNTKAVTVQAYNPNQTAELNCKPSARRVCYFREYRFS
jgi:hypothetical protein